MKVCSKCRKEKPLSAFWKEPSRGAHKIMAQCKECKTDKLREYRRTHPDVDKIRYWKNRDSERQRHLVKKYGITLAGYAEMLSMQGGKCAICGRPEPANKTLDVDHDHNTGKVRGLLCTSCNRMLGHAGDDPERLANGARYLSIVPQTAAEFVEACEECLVEGAGQADLISK